LERLWAYIQREKLIDPAGGGGVKMDDKLKRLFGMHVAQLQQQQQASAGKTQFWMIAEAVNRYLAPADPVVLQYTTE
jgi:chromatin remodeling complex protein RSC6